MEVELDVVGSDDEAVTNAGPDVAVELGVGRDNAAALDMARGDRRCRRGQDGHHGARGEQRGDKATRGLSGRGVHGVLL
jgi:hypothetical protein